jgi:hypothetical protein
MAAAFGLKRDEELVQRPQLIERPAASGGHGEAEETQDAVVD